MTDRQSFRGKVALVTGAASGIGRATALAFACAGARVMLADIDPARAESAARDVATACRGSDGEAASVRADVSSPADVRA